MPNFNSFIAAGVDLAFFGTLDTSGYLKGGGLTAPAANATGSVMNRLRAVQNADPTVPQPDTVNIGGDNISQGSFTFASEANVAFNIDKGVFDILQNALVQRLTTFEEGGQTLGLVKPNQDDPEDICWIIQSPSKKMDPGGTRGLKAWAGYYVPISNVYPGGRQAFQTRAGAVDRWRVSTTPAEMLFNGLLLNEANFAAPGGNLVEFTNDYPIYAQRWTGNGTLDEFTLAYTPAEYNADQIVIRVNGVLQTYTTAYAASGLTVTFVDPPASNAKIVAVVGYRP